MIQAGPAFVHLLVHTEYSLVDGLLRVKPLVEAVAAAGMPAVAVTDQCNLFSLVKFYNAAQGAGVKPVVGLDAWGDTQIGEGSIKWSAMQGDKNVWRTLQVSTEAVFEVMTVYVAGWRKYAALDDGRIWIDNVVLSGPIPQTPPSPPEEEPPDPDANIPATVGNELVANSGFEGNWSNGLAGNWTSWSTAGSGYWRQSTRIGKVGAGKYDFGEATTVKNMNPKTALTMQIGDDHRYPSF